MQRTVYSNYYDDDLVFNHLFVNDVEVTKITPHSHVTYELFYLKTGELQYTEDNRTYKVTSNSLILTRPCKIHSMIFESPHYDRYDMTFNINHLYSNIINQIASDVVVINCEKYPQLSEIFQKMDLYYRHFKGEDLKNMLFNLIEEIFYDIVILNISTNITTDNFIENPLITRAINYIENNLSNPLTLDELCEELHITKSYLHQLFTNFLNITPKKYINTKKLAKAQETIRLGGHPTDVYYQYGFSDYTSFYKSYKKLFGYPPSQENLHYLSVKTLS